MAENDSKNPVKFRIKLLIRTKRFIQLAREARLSVGLPEYGFEKNHDYIDWQKQNDNSKKVFKEILSIAEEFNLAYNYYSFLEEFIGMGYQENQLFLGTKLNVYIGNQLLQKQLPNFDRVFIEIYPETTIKDIQKFFKENRGSYPYSSGGILSTRLYGFRRLKTKYKVPKNPELNLRLYELKQEEILSKEIVQILSKEFPKTKLTAEKINKKYKKLEKFLTPKKESILTNL